MWDARVAERFWNKVNIGKPDECWLWTASLTWGGYGQFHPVKGQTKNAHRVAWILTHGDPGRHLSICHTCDAPRCCNPAHLFVGTPKENTADMDAKGRRRPARDFELPHTKLSPDAVIEIRALFAARESQSEIARRYGVHQSTVSRIVRGKRRASRSRA